MNSEHYVRESCCREQILSVELKSDWLIDLLVIQLILNEEDVWCVFIPKEEYLSGYFDFPEVISLDLIHLGDSFEKFNLYF